MKKFAQKLEDLVFLIKSMIDDEVDKLIEKNSLFPDLDQVEQDLTQLVHIFLISFLGEEPTDFLWKFLNEKSIILFLYPNTFGVLKTSENFSNVKQAYITKYFTLKSDFLDVRECQ